MTTLLPNDLLLNGEGPVFDAAVMNRECTPFAYALRCGGCSVPMTKPNLLAPTACPHCGWVWREKNYDYLVKG